MPDGRDDPIRPEHLAKMNLIAELIDRAINESGVKCGFALLVFDFGGSVNCISNANRDDVIKAMQEFITRNVARN